MSDVVAVIMILVVMMKLLAIKFKTRMVYEKRWHIVIEKTISITLCRTWFDFVELELDGY